MKIMSDLDILKFHEREALKARRKYLWWKLKQIFVLVCWIAGLVGAAFGSVAIYKKGSSDIKFKTDLDTVTYNETANTSSFDLSVNAIFKRNKLFTATDVQFKLIFKAKDGSVLSEQQLVLGKDIDSHKTEATFSFGEGELAAVNGKVHSVDAEFVEASFVNAVSHKSDKSGFKYLFSSWNNLNLLLWMVFSWFSWHCVWNRSISSVFSLLGIIYWILLATIFTGLLVPEMVAIFLA